MWRLLSLSFVLVFGLGVAVGEDADEKSKRRAQATQDGMRELLDVAWNAPTSKVKQTGSAILTRYQKRDADVVELQFAYGLVLAHHGDWQAAESNFRKVSEKVETNPDVWLALGHVHLRSGKAATSLDDLRKAWQIKGDYSPTVETLAVLVTFLSTKPPAKFRPEDARKIEDEIFPKLSPASQAEYRAAQEWTKQYIDQLPTLREELMQPVQALREDADKARMQARDQELDLNEKIAEANRRQARINQIEASTTEDAARLDRLIQAAVARGDTARAQAYQAEKVAAIQAGEAQADVERARLNENRVELERLQSVFRDLVTRAEQLTNEVDQAEVAIDIQLKSPPPVWDASSERARLLNTGTVGPRTEKPAKPAGPKAPRTDDDRARSLLQIADSLRASGLPELAKRYFERIATEFPNTLAGKDAAWELEQIKDAAKTKEVKPKRKGNKRSASG